MEEKNNEHILVTGASGCVGANLVKNLVEQGEKVSIFILPNTWHPFLDQLNIRVIYGDVMNKEDVQKAMQGCTQVYHVAGVVSYNLLDHNLMHGVHVLGTRNILEIAKELDIKKVVVTASTAGIGIPEDKTKPLNEDAPFDVVKYKKVMYMYSKHLGMKECMKAAENGLNVSMVSPTTIYGQGDITMHIGKVVKKIKEGKLKSAPPGGNAVVSVDDIIQAHKLVMQKGKSGENYIFANECMPYTEMFSKIATLLGKDPITKTVPKWILPVAKPILTLYEKILFPLKKKPMLSAHSLNFSFKFRYFDSTKAREELGWVPKDSFDMAMQKAIIFYEEHNLL